MVICDNPGCKRFNVAILGFPRFCTDCGQQLKGRANPTCPKCNGVVSQQDKFCGNCGHQLVEFSEIGFSVRARKCLGLERIETVGDLIQKSAKELICTGHFSIGVVEEVQEKLNRYGLKLKNE